MKGVAQTMVSESHEALQKVCKWMGANCDHWSCRMQRMQNSIPFTMYGVFCLTVFSDFNHYKFWVCEAHFHAESIGASSMIIACNSGKVLTFLLGFSTWTYYSAWLMEFQATLCFWHHVGERDCVSDTMWVGEILHFAPRRKSTTWTQHSLTRAHSGNEGAYHSLKFE